MAPGRRTLQPDLVGYLALTFGLSSIWYVMIARGSGLEQGHGELVALMWTPALAAVVTQLVAHRTLRGLGWRLPSLRWAALGYGLPLAYSLVAYGAVWLVRLGAVDPARAPGKMVSFVVFGSLISLATATGEEIGWRGFLVPALLHASHNLYVQGFFDRITVDTGITSWLVGEFGAVFAATLVATAILFILMARSRPLGPEATPDLR